MFFRDLEDDEQGSGGGTGFAPAGPVVPTGTGGGDGGGGVPLVDTGGTGSQPAGYVSTPSTGGGGGSGGGVPQSPMPTAPTAGAPGGVAPITNPTAPVSGPPPGPTPTPVQMPGTGIPGSTAKADSKQIDKDTDAQKKALSAQSQAQQGLNTQTGQLTAEEAQRQAAEAAAARQRIEAAHAKAQAESDAIAKQSEQLFNTPVDPEHWMHSRSTGQKVAAVISQIAAGFTSGWTGRDVRSPVDDAIEKDIDAQKATLANKHAALSAKSTLLGQNMQLFSSKEAALAQTEAQLHDSAIAMIKGRLATSQNAVEQANLQKALADEQAKSTALKQQARTLDLDNRVKGAQLTGVGLENQQKGLQLQAEKNALANPQGQPPPKDAVFLDGQMVGRVQDDKQREEIRSALTTRSDVLSALQALRAASKGRLSGTGMGEDARAAAVAGEQLITALQKDEGLSRDAGGPKGDRVRAAISPQLFGGSSQAAALDGLEALVERHTEQVMRGAGLPGPQSILARRKLEQQAQSKTFKPAQ